MCAYAARCPKKLVRHCLEEIEESQKFACSRCGVTKPVKYWTMLHHKEHSCFKRSREFKVIRSCTSLDELKMLLKLGPKIEPSVVDSVIR